MAEQRAGTDASGTGVQPPWCGWVFVAAAPFAFLALVTPWFGAVAPLNSAATVSYSAWTHPWLGMIGPWLLLWFGGHWFGAQRGWWQPMAAGAWKSAGYGAGALVLLGVNRALFHPFYARYGLGDGQDGVHGMAVHADFGCWCLMIAAGLFLAGGLLGAALDSGGLRARRAGVAAG